MLMRHVVAAGMVLLVLAGCSQVEPPSMPAAAPLREFTNSIGMKYV